jgi:hypothetical protein
VGGPQQQRQQQRRRGRPGAQRRRRRRRHTRCAEGCVHADAQAGAASRAGWSRQQAGHACSAAVRAHRRASHHAVRVAAHARAAVQATLDVCAAADNAQRAVLALRRTIRGRVVWSAARL